MATPPPATLPESFGVTRLAGARASPSTAKGGSSLREEAIWKRLREAGFDEETVKRRDKAALITYVTRLEAEIYDYQCNMGLILLEKKDLESKYNEIKASAESAEIIYKRDKAANLSALGEARKREENLKQTLGIEKECLANIEKTLHETLVESAETKVACERKLVEAQSMMETAQRMFDEAKSKTHEAEASQAEARRRQNTALRTLQDVEAREDELRRRIASFHAECEAKEKEVSLQRQSMNDSQKILHQEQERLMEGQSLLNQREEHLHVRLKELSRAEKELAEAKLKFENDSSTFGEEKANLELNVAALANREEALIKREALIDKKDRELLILQEKISNKEFDEIQRLKAEYQYSFERKTFEFEAEMEQRRKSLEGEMEMNRNACSVFEAELKQREQQILKMENSVRTDLHAISEKQEDVMKKLNLLEEKEKSLLLTERTLESKMQDLQKEKKEIDEMREELHKEKISFEDVKMQILRAEEKLAITANERNELLVIERKLKEEIDSFRAQMLELEVQAGKLKSEKEKFEIEWDLIDEKTEVLRKEAERIAEERRAVDIHLRNELDSLNAEKESLREQLKRNAESLSIERDDFMRKMEREHSDWFIKFHKEKEDFLNDVKIQRKELENSICRRREDVENYLKEKEEAFEQEKSKELQSIVSQKEEIAKQLRHAASELKRLDMERMEIAHDREQRQKEWSEINHFIEELNVQREKLQKQRELLHADREEIDKQIQHLLKLEHSNIELESRTLYDSNADNPKVNIGNLSSRKGLYQKEAANNSHNPDCQKISLTDSLKNMSSMNASDNASPLSAPMTWFRKCAEVIFKLSPERVTDATFQGGVGSGSSTSLQHYHENIEDVQNLEFKSNEEEINHPMEDGVIAISEEKHKSNISKNMLPLRRKRPGHAASNGYNSSKSYYSRKHPKKLRQNSVAEMEAVLDCPDVNNGMLEDQTAEEALLEAAVLSEVIRLADANGSEMKEDVECDQQSCEDIVEEEDEQPSLGAKIKKFLIT
ncbi:protein CROWDED NUCLEI 4 [Dendrobium catenatum]|nr:protein CROWDED NUCLEI 4 [Dendrobium catenatum]